MSLFSSRRIARLALTVSLVAAPVAWAHDEDEGDHHHHHHHHGVVIQPRNFDHATDLIRDGLQQIGEAVARGDMHALHELSDGVAVPARAMGKLAAAKPGSAPANIRAINTLGQDLATLVDAMHVAADSGKSDVVVAKWKEIEGMMPQLDTVAPRYSLNIGYDGFPETAGDAVVKASLQDATGSTLKSYEPHGDHAMHLFVVDSTLQFFVHAAANADISGFFTFAFKKGSTTRHTLFSVSKPLGRVEPLILASGDMELLNSVIPANPVITPDTEPSKSIDGYLARISGHDHVHAGEPVTLTYMIDETAKPGGITTEDIYGGPAHFVAVSAARDRLVTATAVERTGTGELRVQAVFPAEGVYGTWLEFKHAGKVITVPFVIDVHGDH